MAPATDKIKVSGTLRIVGRPGRVLIPPQVRREALDLLGKILKICVDRRDQSSVAASKSRNQSLGLAKRALKP